VVRQKKRRGQKIDIYNGWMDGAVCVLTARMAVGARCPERRIEGSRYHRWMGERTWRGVLCFDQ
jgi:hypothetical protein